MPVGELSARVYEPGNDVRTQYLSALQTAAKDEEDTRTANVRLHNGSHETQTRPTARHRTGQGPKERRAPTNQTNTKQNSHHNLGMAGTRNCLGSGFFS